MALMVVSTMGYGQSSTSVLQQKISFEKSRLTVRYLLKEVFPNAGISISYLDNYVPLGKKIKTESRDYSVAEILELICRNEDLGFEQNGSQILLKFYQRPDSEYRFSVYGRVKDAETGEALIGASVIADALETGIATNGYGVYSLTLSRGIHSITISYVGYEQLKVDLDVYRSKQFDFRLQEKTNQLDNVNVGSSNYFDLNTSNVLSSANRLDMEMAKNIPYLGEVDVFQSSLLLPGITNIGEGAAGINVRGGSADQNLFMLDEAVVYTANHFFGLISVFNPDAVKDVEILKGDLPARYGGRNSSVMHVRQKEGNEYETHLSGGIGLITSRLMLEGPMLDGKASYLVSGRSTFWDLLLQTQRNPIITSIESSFRDFNTKVKFNINKNNKIYLATYFGSDNNDLGAQNRQSWGNRVMSVRWNNIVKDRHFINLTGYGSQYRYRVFNENEFSDFIGESTISDAALKWDMTSYVNPWNIMEYGISTIMHQMNPGQRIPGPGSSQNEIRLQKEYALEPSLYFSSENRISDKITTYAGLRLSMFYNTGNSDQRVYEEGVPRSEDSVIEVIPGGTRRASQLYYDLLPRLTFKYNLTSESALKVGYFKTVQYMHLLSDNVSPTSEDVWKISDKNIKPTIGRQFTLGYYHHFKKTDFDTSFELFYKRMSPTVEFRNGADLLFNNAIETELLQGKERIYGLEMFLKKSFGKLTGWIGYTLSKAEKRVVTDFPEETINDGDYYPSEFDRTHDLSLTASYSVNDRISFSSNFVYYTGRPSSFPVARYAIDGILVPHFSDRNEGRLANYHRLDMSATVKNSSVKRNGRPKRFESSWVFSIYNVYNRRNTQSYFFTYLAEDPSLPDIQKISVLGSIIPSLTYNFEF